MVIYGDTSGTLSGHEHGQRQVLTGDLVFGDASIIQDAAKGGNDRITGIAGYQNTLYGDAQYMYGTALGGKDILTGGNSTYNYLHGDADEMHDSAKGGNDTLTGGNAGSANALIGDAYVMYNNAKGGNDTLVGGNSTYLNTLTGDAHDMYNNAEGGNDTLTGTGGNSTSNNLYGDAVFLYDNAKGGDDTLTGGNAGSANALIGDAVFMYDNAKGGNDRLVSGPGNDQMWGDAQYKASTVVGGSDVFVFAQSNGHDTINDFEHGKDHIDLTAFKKLTFANLQISSDGQGDSIIDLGKGNTVTVVGDDHLTASDFYFNTGKAPTVSNGADAANIALFGQYTAASFVLSADGFGGTLIHDPPPATLTQMLTQPQDA